MQSNFNVSNINDSVRQILRGQYDKRVRGYRLETGSTEEWVWFDQTGEEETPLKNRAEVIDYMKRELKLCADAIIRQLKGRDDRGEDGQVFSNWSYVVLCANVFDYRKYKKKPRDFDSMFDDTQLKLVAEAEVFRKENFLDLFNLRRDQILRQQELAVITNTTLERQWVAFQRHVFLNMPHLPDYYDFWEACHKDDVLNQESHLVLALNTIVNTECGSNATAEHLGHMTNIITRADRQRLKPLSASSEMVICYLLPSLPDIMDLKLHTKIGCLWKKVGGRDPCGSSATQMFKKSGILLKNPARPKKKNIASSSTTYFKKETHIYDSNKLKRGFFDRM